MSEFNNYLVYVENKPLIIRFIGTQIEEILEYYNIPYRKLSKVEYENIKLYGTMRTEYEVLNND